MTEPAYAATGDQLHKLLPDDGAADDLFGASVSISGNIALVGAVQDGDNGTNSGSAYLFDVITGNQLHKLTPDDGGPSDAFGASVAISGNIAVIGALNDGGGSAYVFDATTGGQLRKLVPDNPSSRFGGSMAVDGNIAIIGSLGFTNTNGISSGEVFVFDVATGSQLHKLLPNDPKINQFFGTSMAIRGNTAIIGAFGDGDNGSQAGAAYLFDLSTGGQLRKLVPNDPAAGDGFGSSVAITGNTALVAAPIHDAGNGAGRSGSVYIFDVTSGNQLDKLTPNDGIVNGTFGGNPTVGGSSLAVSGNVVVVGADGDDDNGDKSGSVYLFDLSTGNQIAKLMSDDGAAGDALGQSLAISGNTAIVGAFGNDDNGSRSGSAYLFEVTVTASTAMVIDNFIDGSVELTGHDRAIQTGLQGVIGNSRDIGINLAVDGKVQVQQNAGSITMSSGSGDGTVSLFYPAESISAVPLDLDWSNIEAIVFDFIQVGTAAFQVRLMTDNGFSFSQLMDMTGTGSQDVEIPLADFLNADLFSVSQIMVMFDLEADVTVLLDSIHLRSVPVPTTLSLLAVGVLGMSTRRRQMA